MAPETALKQMEDGSLWEVDVDGVEVGDILLVKTGAKLPVDGTVVSGEGSVNEASITGRSLPVAKEQGSTVYAGTILDNGTLRSQRIGLAKMPPSERLSSWWKRHRIPNPKQSALSIVLPGITLQPYWPWVFWSGCSLRDVELAITILVLGCPGALVRLGYPCPT